MKIKQFGEVYHKKLSNTGFAWDWNSFPQTDTVSCVTDLTDKDMNIEWISKMKIEKAARPSGVVPKMVKAAREAGLYMTTDLVNEIIVGVIIVEWELSTISDC